MPAPVKRPPIQWPRNQPAIPSRMPVSMLKPISFRQPLRGARTDTATALIRPSSVDRGKYVFEYGGRVFVAGAYFCCCWAIHAANCAFGTTRP